MTRKRGEIAQVKLRMLEIYSKDPLISDAEVSRLCKIDTHTVAKYKRQLEALLTNTRIQVENKIEKVTTEKVSIFQTIMGKLGL